MDAEFLCGGRYKKMLSESKATHAEQLEQSRKQLDKVMSPCHFYLSGRWGSTTGCTLSGLGFRV
jgi:hypothetical protein